MENRPLINLIKLYKNLFIAEGIAFIILGIFAMLLPQLFALTLDYFIGWLFILSAIALGYRAIVAKSMPNKTAILVNALLYLVLGILLLVYPLSGILTLTLLIAFYFLFDGCTKIYAAIQMKALKSWVWILTSGILSLILAALILASWPGQASWILGMLVGINLFITGITTLGFIWAIKRLP